MLTDSAADAPDDLAARFTSVLSNLAGRSVNTEVLFETLRLETLDWGLDHGVETQFIAADKAVPVREGQD